MLDPVRPLFVVPNVQLCAEFLTLSQQKQAFPSAMKWSQREQQFLLSELGLTWASSL